MAVPFRTSPLPPCHRPDDTGPKLRRRRVLLKVGALVIFNLDDAFAAFVLQILTDKLRAVIVTDYGSVSALVGGLFCTAHHLFSWQREFAAAQNFRDLVFLRMPILSGLIRDAPPKLY